MAVMVDELATWTSKGLFGRGSCHLTATSLDELHAFAARIGLKRSWFQPHGLLPHYDLTPSKRKAALARGAVFVPIREQLLRRRGGAA